MKSMTLGILSTAGSLGSFFGGIFSALQFFTQKSVKKNRKIVWRVYQFSSLRVSKLSYEYFERVQ